MKIIDDLFDIYTDKMFSGLTFNIVDVYPGKYDVMLSELCDNEEDPTLSNEIPEYEPMMENYPCFPDVFEDCFTDGLSFFDYPEM